MRGLQRSLREKLTEHFSPGKRASSKKVPVKKGSVMVSKAAQNADDMYKSINFEEELEKDRVLRFYEKTKGWRTLEKDQGVADDQLNFFKEGFKRPTE